jgi:hypothetical protein
MATATTLMTTNTSNTYKMSRSKKVSEVHATLDFHYREFKRQILGAVGSAAGIVGGLAIKGPNRTTNRFLKGMSLLCMISLDGFAKTAIYDIMSAKKIAKENNIPDYVDVDLGIYQGTRFGKWFYLPTDSPVYYIGSYLYPDLTVEDKPATDLKADNKVDDKVENTAFKVVQYVDPNVELYVDPDLDIKDLYINPDNEPSDPPSSK